MLLIVIPKSAGLLSQIALAEELFESGQDVCLWMSFSKESMDEATIKLLEVKPWKLIFEEDYNCVEDCKNIRSKKKLRKKIEEVLPDRKAKVFNALFESYIRKIEGVRAAVKAIGPKVILVSSDGIAGDLFLTSVVKRLGIPIICCPYGYCSEVDLEQDIKIKIENGRDHDINSPGGELVKKLFPKWLKRGVYENHLFFSPEVILAREVAGISLKKPWRVYGSEADAICVPSLQYKKHLMSEGFRADRIFVIGSISGDRLWRQVRKSAEVEAVFRQPKKIQAGVTKVLVSMPPSYHSVRGQFTSFPESYSKLIDGITRLLRLNQQVVLTVSVHPSVTDEDMACFEQLGISVIKGNVLNLIPEHDIYISDFSSTIRWAIASGKPTINYDFYKFELDAYDGVAGVVTVRKHEEYEELLIKMIKDDDFYCQQARRQIEVADTWGIINGMFLEQLIATIDGVVQKKTSLISRCLSILSYEI